MTVTELFKAADLQPDGPAKWGEPIAERRCGIYVVALGRRADEEIDISYLPREMAARWIRSESIVYVGRSRRPLCRRIHEFYKHPYGESRPHRGGQDVKLLKCPLYVYWGATDKPSLAEHQMIEYFKATTGCFPFGNRIRSAQPESLKAT